MIERLPTDTGLPDEPLYLAIDQGGQSSRALVFNRAGRVQASKAVAVGTQRPGSGWVEQDPIELLESVRLSLAGVAEDLGGRIGSLQAAGLATQRSSVVCWDRETGEPLSPVISWQDRRGETQIQAFRHQAERVREITGLVLSAHYGATKIRWCLDHLPAVAGARREERLACGPLASYLLFNLCEEQPLVVDPAIAARTLLWDIETLDWSPELLEMFGVPRALLPQCVPSRHGFGRLRVRGESIPLTVSTGDQSAALFAEGALLPDVIFVNLGTGAFLQRLTSSPRASECRLLDSVVWFDGQETLHALEGSINGCGSALVKMCREFALDSETIAANAGGWLARPEPPPLFLNGVSGLGSPYWVADYPTQMVGSGEPWQVMVAVFESVLFLLQVNLEEMSRELGVPKHIEITGGLAASDGLCQRLADLTGLEIVRSDVHEATARGLAFLVAGRPQGVRSDKTEVRFVPRARPPLEARYRRWRSELESRLPTSTTLV